MNREMMPREKALEYGMESLSNNELLALVIKSAYRDKSVFELVEEIFEAANGFQNLLTLSYEELTAIKGIKKAKAMEILAILEIARRISKVDKIAEQCFDQPSKVVDWLRFSLAYSSQEQFFAVFLDGKGSIIRSEVLYKGNRNSSVVGIDELMRKAILCKASYILVAHNHPSDNVKPSQADINLTEKLARAAQLLNIPLIDHIIIGKSDYFSFKNNNMLK